MESTTTCVQPTRTHPFSARLLARQSLTSSGSVKETYHMVLDLQGSGIEYRPGDSIGIFPKNDPHLVDRILTLLKLSPDTTIQDRQGKAWSLGHYLSERANICRCSKKLLGLLTQGEERPSLEALDLKAYLQERRLWDLLEEYPNAQLSPQELVDHLSPLLPRFYSVASSSLLHPEQMDLLVTVTRYHSGNKERLGVCSRYLCHDVNLEEERLPVYLQPTKDFVLPDDDSRSIIMVGPGTGVAPFRGFMQERQARCATGKNWLFFGECHRATDFYYDEEWMHLEREGLLKLTTAFSRDQEEKIYVQHRLWECRKEVYAWLMDGAVFYVCGDAGQMAKAVDETLHRIIEIEGGMSVEDAKIFIKSLRSNKSYLRDVY